MAMRDKIEHAIQNQPCTVKDLKNKFGGDRGADRKVMEAVDQLVHEAVICQRQGVFFTVRSGRADKALLCKVVKLGKNFAFVMLEDGTSDIFIPGRFTRGAMPGDKVLVEKFEHPRVEGSDEGEILAILEEKNSLVGTARRIEGRLKFVPDDCPAISMQLMRDCEGGANDGDKVAVEILQRGNRQEDHRVGVAMRFGNSDEAKRCAKALLYAQDIRSRFPDKVRDEAKKLENAEVSEKDTEGRMDLRALPIFTIDSAETKDIDDAISLTKTPEGGFELGVHIADVSNYVKPGTELDNEAFNRATSVYYADQVVPMLPKQLSNGICSLNEGALRLAFSCLMRLDENGEIRVRRYVSVDGGMPDNPRFALYGASYTCLLANKLDQPAEFPCSVVGRCCESGDIIQEHVLLPGSVGRGDILAVCTTGAYNYSMASNYNRLPRPPIVMLRGGNESYVAVRRESLEDLCRNDL